MTTSSDPLPQQTETSRPDSPVKAASTDKMTDAPSTLPQPQGSRTQVKTPEPRIINQRLSGHRYMNTDRSPSTPGHLAPFDWEEFEARFEEALGNANREEQELLAEFDNLVKFFNVWASSASVYDTDRGVKRLQTRERFVKIAEQSLLQKKKHLTEVVRAFQSALALLSQNQN